MSSAFRIESLSPAHDRTSFSSGAAALDRYLLELATQDIKRRVSNCFVALDDADVIMGFYTFSAASMPVSEISSAWLKKLPKYDRLPAALVGRLAVDRRFRGKGVGGALIFDAIERAARAEPAIFTLVVDAKDASAVAFYKKFGFEAFASRPASLFLPVAVGLRALREAGLT